MKFQSKIITRVLKENWLWMILFLFLVALDFIMIYVQKDMIPITERTFKSLIGINSLKNMNWISILLAVYQVTLTVVISYRYLTYEKNHSYEFFKLRKKPFKDCFFKLVTLFCFLIFIRFIYAFSCWILLKSYITFDPYYCFINIVFHLIASVIVCFLIQIRSKVFA